MKSTVFARIKATPEKTIYDINLTDTQLLLQVHEKINYAYKICATSATT